MDLKIVIDWKFVAALGGSIAAIILVKKLSPNQAKDVLINASNSYMNHTNISLAN